MGWKFIKCLFPYIKQQSHVNKTMTYEDPDKDIDEDPPPQPRTVELSRDPQRGFGFVAGSEKPVIVRFVKEGGPSETLLLPEDRILKINGEDVIRAPREHVIELVKSCKHTVTLTVCQPYSSNSIRKSALLTAAKKAKLKSNPSRVRFAEGVVINGSPLYWPSFGSYVPLIPNVLKVFLENGQTKTFKYDSTTTVEDVLSSLQEKLSFKCRDHFSLVCEHIKPSRRNRLTLLDPKHTLAKIASMPGAHNLCCLLRVVFVPRDAYDLLQKDAITFEYLYQQCCNDIVQERFSPELKYEIALRLAALHLHEHAMSNNSMMSASGKVNLKVIERECGLGSFVPHSLLETMKRKELHKLLNHFLKQNHQLCPHGQRSLTPLQAKLHYLKIISDLPSYGGKIFSTNIKDSTFESALLVSPKFGISHISPMRNSLPILLSKIEDIESIRVTKDDELCYSVELHFKNCQSNIISNPSPLTFSLEDKDAEEFILVIRGYHKLLNNDGTNLNDKELPVFWDVSEEWWTQSAPGICDKHDAEEAQWSYVPIGDERNGIDLSVASPQYMPCDLSQSSKSQFYAFVDSQHNSVDHNMNEEVNQTHEGIDLPSVVSMEILESQVCEENVKREDIIKRVSEMHKIVADAESYLADKDQSQSLRVSDEENIWKDDGDHLKATDSLLLLVKRNGATNIGSNGKQNVNDAINGELSPCESDTDSLTSPNESPLRRVNGLSQSEVNGSAVTSVAQLTNGCAIAAQRMQQKHIPSFGLHSPDIFPNVFEAEHEITETLQNIHDDTEYHMPFDHDTLYLEHDIIDLTTLPPPDTPDSELIGSSILIPNAEDPPTPYRENIDLSCFNNVDSARVVAELDHLCDTLSEMQTSTDINESHYNPKGIDEFIATMTVPPPPPANDHSEIVDANNGDDDDEYLSTLIIPPPPCTSPTDAIAQDDVIARFWKVTDDMKNICNYDDSSPRLFKREVHSSSSGESGYDSQLTSSSGNSDWPVFPDGGSPKLCLPTVNEVGLESDNSDQQSYHYHKKGKSKSSCSSCEDIPSVKDVQCEATQTNVRLSPNMSRSHSWTIIPHGSELDNHIGMYRPPKHPKPPIPPQSPSIQEKRRQNAMKSNGITPISGSPKLHKLKNGNVNRQQHNVNGYHHQHPIIPNIIVPSSSINSLGIDLPPQSDNNSIFIQSQRDIDVLLSRIEDVHDNRLRKSHTFLDSDKFMATKEVLINESRLFVTSSKLFVKCATEASSQVIEYLFECITQLERMFNVSELVIMQLESPAQVTCLVDRLKEVAATYAYTVDTVEKLSDGMCSPSSSPYMGLLMNHATSLATALSALMRTLRAMN